MTTYIWPCNRHEAHEAHENCSGVSAHPDTMIGRGSIPLADGDGAKDEPYWPDEVTQRVPQRVIQRIEEGQYLTLTQPWRGRMAERQYYVTSVIDSRNIVKARRV